MAHRAPNASNNSAALVQRAAQICQDNKANDIVVLNLKPVTDMTDFFVVASGTSDTHVRSVAEKVIEELKKEGSAVHHVEGLQQGRWVLLDYVDFVVHLFHPTLRQFYQLERLWGDAEVVEVLPKGGAAGSSRAKAPAGTP
jgi:ribosome-associated protein